jgi:hypothetical protein
MAFPVSMKQVVQHTRAIWGPAQVRAAVARWRQPPYSATVVQFVGTVLATLFFLVLNRTVVSLPNPGLISLWSSSKGAAYERG